MGYIGKPQSADPITVNTSNITDGSIQAVDISSSFREAISGSFTDASASFSTRVTTAESELSNTLISSSAQIATDISGSFTAASSSFSTRTTTLEGASATTGSNSFNGNQTVTGSLTVTETIIAQEFKTEFVSASITFTSGSTKFGDTADDIHQMTGSLRITGSGDHYITDGNVGIGTTSPEVKLHIEDGNLALRNTYGIHIDDAAGTRRWVIQMDAGDDITIGDTAIDNINFDVGSKADAMVILDGGNVGIGTASPSRLLDLETTNAAGSTLMSLVSATDGNCQLLFGDTSSDTQGKVFYNNDGDYMAFTANGSEAIRIDSSGNVGIGDTSPPTTLTVNKTATNGFTADTDALRFLGNSGASGYRQSIGWIDNNTRAHATVQIGYVGQDGGGAGYGHFFVATSPSATVEAPTERMRVDSSGNVGIGTTSPSSALQVVGAFSSQIKFGTNTSVYTNMSMGTGFTVLDSIGGDTAAFDFRDDGTSRMYIDSSGNVLVGTTSFNGVSSITGFEVYGNTSQILLNNPSTNHFTIYSAGDSNIYNIFGTSGSWLLGTGNKDTSSFSQKLKIESSGNATFSGEVNITANATYANNVGALDVISDSSGAGGNQIALTVDTNSTDSPTRLWMKNNGSPRWSWDLLNAGSGSHLKLWKNNGAVWAEVVKFDNSTGDTTFSQGDVTFSGGGYNGEIDSSDTGKTGFQFHQTGVMHHQIDYNTSGAEIILLNNIHSVGATCSFLQYRTRNTVEGSLIANSSGLSISNNSDYRKKERITDLSGSLDAINSLRPRQYYYREGFGKPTRAFAGFIAHELQDTTLSHLTTGTKDQVVTQEDLDNGLHSGMEVGDPVYQTVSYADNELITHLVKSVQELTARIEALES